MAESPKVTNMMSYFKPAHLPLAAACLWQALIVSPPAYSQSTPGDAQQDLSAQPAQQTPSAASSLAPAQKRSRPNDIALFDNLFQFVGMEDDLIQKQTQEGKQQVITRTDYSTAIGINTEEEHSMLSIILDAYHQRVANKKEFEDADDKYWLAKQTGTLEDPEASPPNWGRIEVLPNNAIMDAAWAQLREALGEEDFKKLDAYVWRDFTRFRSPSGSPAHVSKQTSFPVNNEYELFIVSVEADDAYVKRERLKGNHGVTAENYSREAHFPEEEEESILAIAREAQQRLIENDKRYVEANHELAVKTGVYGHPNGLLSPEEKQLNDQRVDEYYKIIDETKEKVRQELGEENFEKFDAWLKRRWGVGTIIQEQVGDPSNSQH